MDREAALRAAAALCRALGRRASYETVNAMIATVIGKGFRKADVLKSLAVYDREPRGNHAGTVSEHNGNYPGTTAPPLNGPLFSPSDSPVTPPYNPPVASSSSLRSSSSAHVAPQRGAERGPKAQKLPLDRDLLDKRSAILHAVWQELQPFVNRAVTFSGWRARNSRIATDLARVGWDAEQVVKWWRLASDVRGEPVRELSLVQKHIEKVAAKRTAQKAQAPR